MVTPCGDVSSYIGIDGISVTIVRQDCRHISHRYAGDLVFWIDHYFETDSYKLGLMKYHRIDGPSLIHYGVKTQLYIISEEWSISGVIHRSTGPAMIWYRNGVIIMDQWYFNGVVKTHYVNEWLRLNSSLYGISKNWWEWSDDDRIIFKLVYSGE